MIRALAFADARIMRSITTTMRPGPLILALFALLLLGACQASERDPGWQGARAGTPALWHIRGRGSEAWLFGSIHTLPQGVAWQSAALGQATGRADRLVLEIANLDEPQAIARTFRAMGNSPGQLPLDRRVDGRLYTRARALQRRAGLPDASFATLESWAAALAFASASTQGIGVSPGSGVEQTLQPQFESAGKPVIGLETAAEQFGYFDRLPDADQRAMLEGVIAEAGDAPRAYRTLLESWLAGDVPALVRATETGLLTRPQIRAAILLARNRNWAAQIDAMIGRGERPFVAVGAAHVAGPDSLQALLAARGYSIERVQ